VVRTIQIHRGMATQLQWMILLLAYLLPRSYWVGSNRGFVRYSLVLLLPHLGHINTTTATAIIILLVLTYHQIEHRMLQQSAETSLQQFGLQDSSVDDAEVPICDNCSIKIEQSVIKSADSL